MVIGWLDASDDSHSDSLLLFLDRFLLVSINFYLSQQLLDTSSQ